MKKIYPYLTYAGTLPFILCAICFVFDVKNIPLLGETYQVLSIYGLVISSFMAGSHWGQHLNFDNNKWKFFLPIFSNMSAILLWIAFLVLPFKVLLVVFAMLFLALLFVDKKLLQSNLISAEYFRVRCLVTKIVVLTLIISGVFV